MVDPYDWLGIPKAQRPPTPYQLLGLPVTIADLAAIRSAADRQLRRILPHMSGENALEAEDLWTELEEARDLLLDTERRAAFDAQIPTSEPEQEPASTAETISADWEESPTPSATSGPDPWWKSAPEASAGGEAWWKQPLPAEASAPPPPVAPVPIATKPVSVKPLGKVDPEIAAIGQASRPRAKKKSSVPILIGGLVMTAAIVGGIYYALNYKSSATVPKEEPVAALPKSEPKPKGPGPVQPKHEEPIPEVPLPKDFADALRAKTFKGHAGAINGLAVASTGSRFVSVGTDKTLRIWSVTKDESILRHNTFISPAMGVAWRDRDRQIIAADGLTLAIFEAAKATAPRPFESAKGGVSALSVAVDGSKAITGLTDGFLRLWDTVAGRPDEWAVAARGPINSVDISADGSLVLAAVADGPVSLWNLASRSRSHEWMPHPNGAIAVRFSPDGARAATTGPEGTATIYDLATKKEICRLDGHAGPVTAIEWLPDGRQVVTVGVDNTARLWSAETGQPLRWNQPLEGKGNSVAVDPGGRFVLAGTTTGNIQLLPLPRVKPELFVGAAKPPSDPLPTPDPASVTAAMADVRTELAREFTYNRPDDLALLADNLRRRATQEKVSASLRFGLLQESRALAIRAGDPLTAFKAIEDLAIWFDLDELHEKASTFASLPAEADGPFLIGVGLEAAERAESDARPEIVIRLLQRLPEKAPANTPVERSTRLNAIRQRASAIAAELKGVRTALDVLKNASDDQASNHVYGTFLCFTRQDWAIGLPHLAKGNDPRFIEAAKADLSTPLDPKAQHRLGELWYGLALDAKDHRARRAMLARARTWFEREAKTKLDVVDAIKARARIEDISKLDVPSKDPIQLPLFAPVQIRRPYNTIAADVIKNEWRLDAGSEAQPERVLLPAGSPSLQSRFGLAAGGKLTLTFEPDGREVRVNCAGQEMAFAGSGKSLRLVIERSEDKLTFRATTDDGEPIAKTTDIPPALRGPMSMTIRLTGTTARAGGTSLATAILRGPASLPLPLAE